MIEEQARLKNHPIVLASTSTNERQPFPGTTPNSEVETSKRVKSNATAVDVIEPKAITEERYCHFHEREVTIYQNVKRLKKRLYKRDLNGS